jgi:hypothetical protein
MSEFTTTELSAIHAALILYRAELMTQVSAEEGGLESGLREKLHTAAGTALHKVTMDIRAAGPASS